MLIYLTLDLVKDEFDVWEPDVLTDMPATYFSEDVAVVPLWTVDCDAEAETAKRLCAMKGIWNYMGLDCPAGAYSGGIWAIFDCRPCPFEKMDEEELWSDLEFIAREAARYGHAADYHKCLKLGFPTPEDND